MCPVVVLTLLLGWVSSAAAWCPESCECEPPVLECRLRLPSLREFSQLQADSSYSSLELLDVDFDKFDYKDYASSDFFRNLTSIRTTRTCARGSRPYPAGLLHLDNLASINVSRGDFDFYALHRLCQFNDYPRLRVFDLSHNDLRTFNLYKEAAQCFPALAYLNLTGNHVYFLKPGKFLNTSIEDLDLSYNEINSFTGVFNGMRFLRKLNIAGNKLENVRADLFNNLTKLKELDISRNRLNYIYPNVFSNTSLEILDLSDNKIHDFANVFKGVKLLKRLNIAGNKLEMLEVDWFKDLGKLEELDISRNKLNFISSDALQPLTSLSVLKVAENPLLERDLSFLLGTGKNLETVDASRIGLVRVPVALTRSVRTLKLVGNHLNYITSGDLDSYPLLTSLDLSDNRLIIIEEDALGRLDALQELILSRNMLPAIPKSLSIWLKVLDLRQNAISKLKANDLQGLHRLKILNLSGNVIDSIEGEFFRQLTALEELDISNNPIKKLPPDFLSGPSNLQILRMSDLWLLETEAGQNHDTAFPILALERLVTLDVSRSPLLASQLLADNAALSACKSLQELDLSYTRITSMKSDLAFMLPQLRKLNLIGNAWNCSPDQAWLGEWMRKHNASRLYSTRCKTPPELEGNLLEEMTLARLTTLKIEEETTKSFATTRKVDLSTIKSTSLKETTTKSSTVPPTTTTTSTEATIAVSNEQTTKSTIATTSLKPTTKKKEDYSKESRTSTTKSITVTNEATTSEPRVTKAASTKPPTTTAAPQKSTKKPLPITTTTTTTTAADTVATTTTTTTTTATSSTSTTAAASSTTTAPERITEKPSTTAAPERMTEKPSTTAAPQSTTMRISPTATTAVPERITQKPTKATTAAPQKSTVELSPSPTATTTGVPEKSTEKISPPVTEQTTTTTEAASVKPSLLSELSRSKLLEEPQEDHPKIVAEELNGRSTDGTHPGMLIILLGAALGAAAALTVVLSRRRGRNYQRQENVEVHALELW